MRWATDQSIQSPVLAIGSAQLLANYNAAAKHFGVTFEMIESKSLLPPVLFAMAQEAGLMA